MSRQNIAKWQVAAIYSSMASTLEVLKKLPDDEIRNGINGIINHCIEKERELSNKPKK